MERVLTCGGRGIALLVLLLTAVALLIAFTQVGRLLSRSWFASFRRAVALPLRFDGVLLGPVSFRVSS